MIVHKLSNRFTFYTVMLLMIFVISGCDSTTDAQIVADNATVETINVSEEPGAVEAADAAESTEQDAEFAEPVTADDAQPADDSTAEEADSAETEAEEVPTDAASSEQSDSAETQAEEVPTDAASSEQPGSAETQEEEASATDVSTPAADATVDTKNVNMRKGPGSVYQVTGSFARGTALEVLGKNKKGSWLKVKTPNGKEGWMSRSLLAVNTDLGTVVVAKAPPKPKPTPGSKSQLVSAPTTQDYRSPTFSWSWQDANKLKGQDWFFDIQLYRSAAQDPYHIIHAEPDVARHVNGIWHFDQQAEVKCDSQFVVQVAKRVDGRFAGWISPKSNSLTIGPSCGGGGAGEAPIEEPPCPGC